MQQRPSRLLALPFLLSFFPSFFYIFGAVQSDAVYLILLCWLPPVWDLIREPLERCLFKSVHVHSE